MPEPALNCFNLELAIGKKHLASDVNLVVSRGESHAIMGASGAGKSTLLWTLIGMLPHKLGEIFVCGQRIHSTSRRINAGIRRDHIGIIYQQPYLINELTVAENVAVPLMLRTAYDKTEAITRATELLERLSIDPSIPTAMLSGGEQQRVAIARASIGNPKLIVADEPTAALDEGNAKVVMQTMLDLCSDYGAALVLVTHDSRIAAQVDSRSHLGTTLVRTD